MDAKTRGICSAVAALALLSLGSAPTYAAETWQRLATAVPDECFVGVGAWPPDGPPTNQYPLAGNCDGQLKTNEAYVWGLTKPGGNIFFGTGQNILCLVLQGFLGQTDSVLTDDYVCELGEGPLIPAAGLLYDNRPPGMYLFNESAGLVSLLNQLGPAEALRRGTLGIRSGGSHQGVAFLAGPSASPSGGINLFAFDADTGTFLGAKALPNYNNVRKWLVGSDGRLYLGVGATNANGGGAVLRWLGYKSADPDVLFAFEVVGSGLDADAAEIAEHEGRLFVATWPSLGGSQRGGGLWMSPPLAQLVQGSAWERIWSASDYDPDPVTAVTYGGGALASFDGWLYWGTMHVPGVALIAHQTVYGETGSDAELTQRILGTWRAFSVFKGQRFGTRRQRIELLYGGSTIGVVPLGWYQAYLCPGGVSSGCDNSQRSWQTVPNRMGLTPRFGRAGVGNAYNNYCWTMEPWNGSLYLGTMDHSYLIYGSGADIPPALALLGGEPVYGADLYRFDSARTAAQTVSLDGLDNPMNYGIRTMVHDNAALYVGTANPMNLNPDGGWELIKVFEARRQRPPRPPRPR